MPLAWIDLHAWDQLKGENASLVISLKCSSVHRKARRLFCQRDLKLLLASLLQGLHNLDGVELGRVQGLGAGPADTWQYNEKGFCTCFKYTTQRPVGFLHVYSPSTHGPSAEDQRGVPTHLTQAILPEMV